MLYQSYSSSIIILIYKTIFNPLLQKIWGIKKYILTIKWYACRINNLQKLKWNKSASERTVWFRAPEIILVWITIELMMCRADRRWIVSGQHGNSFRILYIWGLETLFHNYIIRITSLLKGRLSDSFFFCNPECTFNE